MPEGPETTEFSGSVPGSFPESAQAGLAPVAGAVQDVRRGAEHGDLYMDADAGRALLGQLTDIRSQVIDLISECGDLDQPLKFGDNWVGDTMNQKLRGAAAGEPRAFTPVLEEFQQVLNDLQRTVKYAAGLYTEVDEQTAEDLRKSMKFFDVGLGNGGNEAV
ncbi:MAG: hypothetical protein GEU98_07375 [Pseudonocardiaceae bacterium]|nr:hypothetical protein [Pseudonocardiaceae bacterium]